MKIEPYSKKEMLVVAGVMAAILIPLRLVTIFILNEHWLGSIGILTGVTLFVMIGAKKNKLGWFGRMFINTIIKLQKGKRRFIFYIEATFVFIVMGSAVILIHEGNTTYGHLKDQVWAELKGMDIETSEDVMRISSNQSAEEQAQAIIELPTLFVKEFGTVAVTAAIVNDMMDNWYMYFATLVLIENIEIVGFLIISRRYIKETDAEVKS